MKLTHVEIDRYLCGIFTGSKLTYIVYEDNEYPIVFRSPSNDTKVRADHLRDRSYDRAIADGLLPTDKLLEVMYERGVLSNSDNDKIAKLNEQLKAQETLLSKTTKVKANQDRILGVIKKLKEDIYELESKQIQGVLMSADSKAEEEKTMYLCWACTFNDAQPPSRFWLTLDDFQNETKLGLRDKILVAFVEYNRGIDTSIIRYIARSSLWRIRYVNSQKTSDPLFGLPSANYSNDMLNLVYWSNYYQNIYEMMPEDRPPDSIIDDDDALDAYMQSYYEERNKEDAARRSKVKTSGKLSAFDQEEVIVTQSNELYHDIEYDKPREAQRIKDKNAIRKKGKKG
jgi:hypothetical protein